MTIKNKNINKALYLIVGAVTLSTILVPITNATSPMTYQVASTRLFSGTQYGPMARMYSQHASSGDGRYVVFTSGSSSIVPNDNNNLDDVFVSDTTTGAIQRVSVATDGTEANGGSTEGSISYDGRYVVFSSRASTLTPGISDTTTSHVYLRDIALGTTSLIDQTNSGQVGASYAYNPKVSANGRFVVFMSQSKNLASGYTIAGNNQIYIKDIVSGSFKLLSANDSGIGGNKDSNIPDIDCGGNVVVFTSQATNLGVSSSPWGRSDLIVAHLGWDKVTLKNVSSGFNNGVLGSTSTAPQLSCDGNKVLFTSSATDIVSGGTSALHPNSYIYDRTTSQVTQATLTDTGAQLDTFQNDKSLGASMSPDGRYVAFTSYSNNVVSGATKNSVSGESGPYASVYLRDVRSSTTSIITLLPSGYMSGWVDDSALSLSANATKIFFTHLTPNTTSGSRAIISGYTTGGGSNSHDVYWANTGY